MAILDFPASPTIGQTYTANGSTWTWDGASWNATSDGLVLVTTSSDASNFKVPFANTTASTTGNYGLLQDTTATFTYNPSTNTLVANTFSGALSGNASTATTWQTARTLWGQSVNGSADITAPLYPAAGTAALPAFSTSGDTNTGIYFPAADTIGFSEGGAEVMRIDSSGNVGIGTTSPGQKFSVSSITNDDGIRITNTNSASTTAKTTRVSFYGTDTAGSAKEAANIYVIPEGVNYIDSSMAFFTRFTDTVLERMRIDSSGNLLVGTTSAVERLTIGSGSSTSSGINLRTTQTDFSIIPSNSAAGGVTITTSWVTGGQGPLKFNNASGEIARFDPSGNLGLNTAAPVAKVSINSLVGTPLNYIDGTALQYTSNAGIRVTESNTANASIGGGIDLANNVYSVGAYSPILGFSSLSSSGSFNNTYAGIYGVVTGVGTDTNWVKGALVFATTSDGGAGISERMRIDPAGNVGIGTSSPIRKITVQGASFVGSSFNGIGVQDGSAERIRLGYNDGTPETGLVSAQISANATVLQIVSRDVSNGAISFHTGSGVAERARIDSSGNVGIGVTPSYKLDVLSATTESARFKATGTISAVYLADNNTTAGSLYIGTVGNDFRVVTSSNERMRIDSNGRLLVGTTSEQGMLTVTQPSVNANTASFIASNTGASTFGVAVISAASSANTDSLFRGFHSTSTLCFRVSGDGNVTNTNNSYGAISDVKLKENIVDATPKLEKLNQVQVVNYNLKTDPDQKLIGVVAQQLEQVFPSLIEELSDHDANGNNLGTTTKSVKYSVFIPILIKAIQEQQAIITQLQADVASLKGN